jgi:general secretion pathway protein D
VAFLLGVSLVALSGCGSKPAPKTGDDIPHFVPLPEPQEVTRAASRANGTIEDSIATSQIAVSTGTESQFHLPPQGLAGGAGQVNLDFADTDIREVAAQILGTYLRLPYTIDSGVRGTVTMRTITPITERQLLPVLQGLLAQTGAALVQSNGIYRAVPASNPLTALGTPGTAGAVMVPLRYTGAEDMVKALASFVQGGTKLIAVPVANAVLISGDPAARDAVMNVIAAFDTDVLAGQSYALLPVTNGDAGDFATAFGNALHAQQGGTLAAEIKVVPLSRVNAVLVVAATPRYLNEARRLYALIDRGRRETARSWHVYYLQNSTANDTAYIMQEAFTPGDVTAQPSARASGQSSSSSGSFSGFNSSNSGSSSSGMSSGSTGTSGGSGTGGASGGLGSAFGGGSGGQGGLTAAPTTPPSANPLLGGISNSSGNSSTASDRTNTMRIIANPENNALLIFATAEEQHTVETMLHKIDILPLQVRIDAIIAEVTLTDELQYGTQFYFQHHALVGGNGLTGTSSSNTTTTTSASGSVTTSGTAGIGLSTSLSDILNGASAFGAPGANGFLAAGGKDGGALVQALQGITKVKVLSSPELLVLDNETAFLSVGNQVPLLTGSTTDLSGTNSITNTVDYRNTGVITQVTPRVNSGGLVTLDIAQEVSDVAPSSTNAGSTINSPTFTDRAVKSRIVVQDGQTIGLAGLIRDNASTGNTGFPFLKDIPLLGTALSTQDNSRTRTELIVLLTPHVLHDQRDAHALTEDLREELPRAAEAAQDNRAFHFSGSADPQGHLSTTMPHFAPNE